MYNKHILKLIETLYSDYIVKMLGRNVETDFISLMECQIYDLQYYSVMEYLVEAEHITETFLMVAKDIVNLYKTGNFKHNILIYVGWSFNIKTQEAVKENNQNDNVPIYVKFIEEKNSNVNAAVIDREKSGDNIIIEVNTYNIDKCGKPDLFLYQCLCHEFLHVREMFACEDKDILLSPKNRLMDLEEVNIFEWDKNSRSIPNNYFNMAKNVIYYFKESELRARINAVNAAVTQMYKSELSMSRQDKIQYCFDKTVNLSLYIDMLKLIERLSIINDTAFSGLEPVVYYCNIYKLTKTKLKKYSTLFRRPLSEYNQDEKDKFKAFIFELKQLLREYKLNIEKIIYSALRNKNMI